MMMTSRRLTLLGIVGSLSACCLFACGEGPAPGPSPSGGGKEPGQPSGQSGGTGAGAGGATGGSTGGPGGSGGGGGSTTGSGGGTGSTGTGGTSTGGGGSTVSVTGQVSGTLAENTSWSGLIEVTDHVIIPAGLTLTIEPGTLIRFALEVRLTVSGALTGTAAPDQPILFEGLTQEPGSWTGLVVDDGGQLTLTGFAIRHAKVGVATAPQALPSSLTDGLLEAVAPYHAVLGGDASFTRVVMHGGQVAINGGTARFTDVLVDQGRGDDFFLISGGSSHFDFVTVRQHHCPIHANASASITLNRVDFRDNAYAIMLSDTNTAEINDSNFDNGQSIGLYSGNGTVTTSGNYWGGGSPNVEGADSGRFTGSENLSDPVEAGARL